MKVWDWAANTVASAVDRAKRVVSKVMTTESDTQIWSDAAFKRSTAGLESFTQTTLGATKYDTDIFENLPTPEWRRTVDIDTNTVLENRPVLQFCDNFLCADLPSKRNIETTIWFTPSASTSAARPCKPKVRKAVGRSVQALAAVFLLEAMALLSAGSH